MSSESVYVRRRRALPADPGQHPAETRISVDIRVTYPDGTALSYVRQQLDQAYLDALFDLDGREAVVMQERAA